MFRIHSAPNADSPTHAIKQQVIFFSIVPSFDYVMVNLFFHYLNANIVIFNKKHIPPDTPRI